MPVKGSKHRAQAVYDVTEWLHRTCPALLHFIAILIAFYFAEDDINMRMACDDLTIFGVEV